MNADGHDPALAANEPVEASREEVQARGLLGRQAVGWVAGGSLALVAGPLLGRPLGLSGGSVRLGGAVIAAGGAAVAVAAVGEDWVAATRRAVAANGVLAAGSLALGLAGKRPGRMVTAGALAAISGALAARQVRVLVEEQGPVIA